MSDCERDRQYARTHGYTELDETLHEILPDEHGVAGNGRMAIDLQGLKLVAEAVHLRLQGRDGLRGHGRWMYAM